MKSKELKDNKAERTDEIFRRLIEAREILNEAKKQEAHYQTKRPFKSFKFRMIANGIKYGKDNWNENWKEVKRYEK